MTETMKIAELYQVVVDWAISQGADKLNETPGLWHRKTNKNGVLGPLDVRINPHPETIDFIPPYNIKIGMDDYFPGLIALIGPSGGKVVYSPRPGEDEAGIIAHFIAQTPAKPFGEGRCQAPD